MAKTPLHVFISAARTDEAWARDLSRLLEKAGVDTWVSSTDVLPGANSSREVGRALDRADAMVALVSPDAMKSAWVRQEILFALGQERFEGRLVPVLIKRTSTDTIPWTLEYLPWAKGSPSEVARQVLRILGSPFRNVVARKAAARKSSARQAHVRETAGRAEAR